MFPSAPPAPPCHRASLAAISKLAPGPRLLADQGDPLTRETVERLPSTSDGKTSICDLSWNYLILGELFKVILSRTFYNVFFCTAGVLATFVTFYSLVNRISGTK
jgi:hypothetical protein